MTSKRCRDQILAQILETCQGCGASKTRIVYNCNLNFATVKPHLDLLIANGLLEAIGDSKVLYVTTENGSLVLRHMKEIERLMPIGGAYNMVEK
jgi:predicted transcriptional regulator